MQNIVFLAGNIGADPETRDTPTGTTITTVRLATSRPRYKDGKVLRDEQGRRQQDTEWHRITCFNGLGKTVQEYCTKGMRVSVRGRIHYTKWTDQQGNDRYGCEIIAETVDFLSRGKPAQNNDNGGNDPFNDDFDDDVPF
ncbi:single-stranded DNA-binding protein [Sphingobium baderi]|uniref:Single-stranded DNA-binding protein n=1 Tax=Sphingobium baderi TaxID=1332080 RepID=A0A0S3EZS4_9SPHN|nr:single-stranded DNA-binding protein [Sphingobium baderi]ALR20948.1 single-stranded DNA-binding protein [Sphingobium baderi]